MNKNKIAIFIDSFDGYSDVWPVFFEIFDMFWKNCPYKKYLVTNNKEYKYKDLVSLKTGAEENWFIRTLKAIECVKEDYIIFMLEDFFISKYYNETIIDEIVDEMQQKNIYYYQLSNIVKLKQNEKFLYHKFEYPVSLQLTIWKKSEFVRAVQESYACGSQTPWDFEKYFIEKFKNKKECPKGIAYDTRDIMGYKNGIIQGKWYPKTINFFKNKDLYFDIGNRPVMTRRETIKYETKLFLSTFLSTGLKNKLKKVLRKLGFKFVI